MLISPSWCACLSDECIAALSAMIFFGLFVISNHLSSRDRKAIGLPSIAGHADHSEIDVVRLHRSRGRMPLGQFACSVAD
jgi:hypothetical protein